MSLQEHHNSEDDDLFACVLPQPQNTTPFSEMGRSPFLPHSRFDSSFS